MEPNGSTKALNIIHSPPDLPTAPGKPEIVDYDDKSVQLKFAAPESDGGAPIIKYIIQKKERLLSLLLGSLLERKVIILIIRKKGYIIIFVF